MRLVLDTNVLISAILLPNSIPANVLNWSEKYGTILYSDSTLAELLSVLQRRKFAKYIDREDIDGLSSRIQGLWCHIAILKRLALCQDPKDDKFLELALNGEATHLITGDSDLLILDPFHNIPVMKPRSFWDSISS